MGILIGISWGIVNVSRGVYNGLTAGLLTHDITTISTTFTTHGHTVLLGKGAHSEPVVFRFPFSTFHFPFSVYLKRDQVP